MCAPLPYSDARAAFMAELVRSANTRRIYGRAIDLFIEFAPAPLARLDAEHRPVLNRFAQWLINEGYAPATAILYLVAVRRWFEWMAVNDFLPAAFPVTKALAALDDARRGNYFKMDRRPPLPPEGIEATITYYDTLTYTGPNNPDRARRWALEMLRNRALMRVLAETGGRVSEVVSLAVGDFPERAFSGDVWRVRVRGKGQHEYDLRFLAALPYVRAYIQARGEAPATASLFINHSKRYDGQSLSRYGAWQIVERARRALGLARIHPHDFRHQRACDLLNAGVSLDVVQDYLGHRSVETTRKFYAATDPRRVDDAARAASCGSLSCNRTK